MTGKARHDRTREASDSEFCIGSMLASFFGGACGYAMRPIKLEENQDNRMDIDAANKLQEQIQGSREKYTYFLLTAAGACIGYAVEKVAGVAQEWKLVALALSLIGWGISFWFGCHAIKRSEYGLRYNHAQLTVARSPMDKVALDSLMSDEARASASSNRWQFRFFVFGGVAFVLWRLLELLPR